MTEYEELDEEEREFLAHHSGGVFEILNGTDQSPRREAKKAVEDLVGRLGVLYPSRTERLLVLSAIAEGTALARDELLDEIIAGRFRWRRRTIGDDWGALAWETWEKRQLASLANLSVRTVNLRVKGIVRSTLDAAIAAEKEEVESSGS